MKGVSAKHADLSADESGNPFFAPTFAESVGGVYQARPYLSPDTHEWVVSNSTPLVAAAGRKLSIVHFEITVESFRRAAALLAGPNGLRVVDRRTGRVVIDKDVPQRISRTLGVPTDRRFASIARAGRRGLIEVAGRQAAYEAVPRAPGNDNDWAVVASAPRRESSLLGSLGGPPLGLILLGVALSAGALATRRRRPVPASPPPRPTAQGIHPAQAPRRATTSAARSRRCVRRVALGAIPRRRPPDRRCHVTRGALPAARRSPPPQPVGRRRTRWRRR